MQPSAESAAPSQNDAPSQAAVPAKKHGKIYWIIRHVLEGFGRFMMRHKLASAILCLVVLWSAFVFRGYWQPYVVIARAHTPEVILSVFALWLMYRSFAWRTWKRFLLVATLSGLYVLMQVKMELPPLRYLTLYLRYQALDLEALNKLPTTDHERIQPLASINVLGNEAMKETEHAAYPDFVRIGNEFRWTMAVEPAYPLPRTFGHVKEVLSVSGLAASPNFSGENRIPVSFRVGEGLYMGKNSRVAVIRSLGIFRFFSYSPRDVKYIKDDKGEWVEVVSLIRWRGLFFVWPEFGGVQIIHQGEDNPLETVRAWFEGDGEWIPPEKIRDYPYLRQQNILPYEVSRYAAQSLRFQNGFFTAFPWYHKGDVRIPDIDKDQNEQPFTAYFKFGDGEKFASRDKLYHYFALEPYHNQKQGLNTSVFIPADGDGPVMVYRHYLVNEALTGVSAIAAKVMESQKQYDWEQSRPVEHRPYIRDIDGKRRFFWLTTVVTYKDKKQAGNPAFIAGSTPELYLTDALYKSVVRVDATQPETWVPTLREKLGPVWKSN